VIGTYSPLPATLLDTPRVGLIITFALHPFLPDGLPPKPARS
jgi:hypothetical protein